MSSIPIIICGRSPIIAAKVAKDLRPRFNTIHVILSVEAGVAEIPVILSGGRPKNTSSNIGSQDYEKRPVAVVVGGGFDDGMLAAMKDACKGLKAVWGHADRTKLSEMPSLDQPELFGAATAVRVQEGLKRHGVGEGVEEGEFVY